jgi:hypothetical protein
LNLVVQDSLKIVKPLQEKVKVVVSHFKRSTAASQKLLTFQRNCGTANPKKLIQDMLTRWNSSLFMFDRLAELQDTVRSTVPLIDSELPVLSAEEWRICTEILKVLKPLEEVSSKLSAEHYIRASQVIVLIRGLSSVCNKLLKEDFDPIDIDLIQDLRRGISKRFQHFEYSKTIALCTFLDPRLNLLGLQTLRLPTP